MIRVIYSPEDPDLKDCVARNYQNVRLGLQVYFTHSLKGAEVRAISDVIEEYEEVGITQVQYSRVATFHRADFAWRAGRRHLHADRPPGA